MSNTHKVNKAYDSRIRRFRKTITQADLTNATNGAVQNIVLGKIPADACIVNRAFRLNAVFTGGGATTCTMSIGTAASPALIMAAADVFGGALGAYSAGTAGPQAGPMPAAVDLVAQFTPSAGQSLLNLTTGSVDVEVCFADCDDGTYV